MKLKWQRKKPGLHRGLRHPPPRYRSRHHLSQHSCCHSSYQIICDKQRSGGRQYNGVRSALAWAPNSLFVLLRRCRCFLFSIPYCSLANWYSISKCFVAFANGIVISLTSAFVPFSAVMPAVSNEESDTSNSWCCKNPGYV